MDKIYVGLEKAYGEMLFCWQETAAGEWQKGRPQHEEKGQKVRLYPEQNGTDVKNRYGR